MGDVKDNGGAAFPRTVQAWNGNLTAHDGMNLRDWFAGQALAGMLADPEVNAEPKAVATVCYNYADAMLEARK